YARQTEPFPVVSLFQDEGKEAASADDVGWGGGAVRDGAGDDGRTGWTASVLGDAMARGRGFVVTVPSHDNHAWRWGTAQAAADSKPARFALREPRPYRMGG